jgi:serine/threonine protein kinase
LSDGLVRYRFLSVVGEGGFGKVYRARLETSEGFHKDVAVKVLSDPDPPKSLLQRFRDEAKILGLIRDRAIVGAEPPIKVGDRWAVVMEFVDGVSLGSLIGEKGLDPGVAVEVVGEAARALHNAFHMQGPDGPLQLLHRDIKPDNVQVTPSGDVRILDFGIARANFSAREFRTRQSLGGTPGYIAPERLQGIELPVGDVFSLGVVLHEAITGQRPKFPPTMQWEAGNVGETTPFPAERDTTGVLLADDEIPEDVRLDPDKMEVLRLAGWMRAEEPEDRPSARQVEDACRKLRVKLPPPYLREWAETRVPHRNEIAPDNMIGQVLTTSMPSSVFVDPNVTPLSLPATYTPQPQNNTPGLAITALISGLSAVVVGLIGAGAIVVVGLILWVVLQPPAPGVEAPGTVPGSSVADVPAPDPVAPVVPKPEPRVIVVDPAPTKVKPPAPAALAPREIVVGDQDPETPPSPPPITPAPAPTRAAATGLVVVKTVPSGATVREGGKALEKSGLGYRLRPGTHTLSIQSPDGETTTIPVSVLKDQTVEICYDFDRNKRCESQ